jgi:hypothetical protein
MPVFERARDEYLFTNASVVPVLKVLSESALAERAVLNVLETNTCSPTRA